MLGGMMTPKGAVLGSARRVASSQARTALAAAAAAAQDTSSVMDRGFSSSSSSITGVGGNGSSSISGAVPLTPLHRGARRAVPVDAPGAVDEVDKHLQSLVERCLRIRNPGTFGHVV